MIFCKCSVQCAVCRVQFSAVQCSDMCLVSRRNGWSQCDLGECGLLSMGLSRLIFGSGIINDKRLIMKYWYTNCVLYKSINQRLSFALELTCNQYITEGSWFGTGPSSVVGVARALSVVNWGQTTTALGLPHPPPPPPNPCRAMVGSGSFHSWRL